MSFIYFLISSDMQIIKRKFIALFILNASDILFTLMLFCTGVYERANAFTSGIADESIIGTFIKFGITLLLLILAYLGISSSVEKHILILNTIITTCMILYFFINLYHTAWCIIYLLT
ncbi:MAG: DUF5658 family protein [Bacillota bacterium]|nr:DUF5658 family protein [Bacillota bacterium]